MYIPDDLLAQAPEVKSSSPLLRRHLHNDGMFENHIWEADLDHHRFSYLYDHRVEGSVVVPATAYLEMTLAAAAVVMGGGLRELLDVEFERALFLRTDRSVTAQINLARDPGGHAWFQISSRTGEAGADGRWTLHATGKIPGFPAPPPGPPPVSLDELRARCPTEVSQREFYGRFSERTNDYGPSFQAVRRLWRRDGEALAEVMLPQPLELQHGEYQFHPVLHDACLHALVAAERGAPRTFVPKRIDCVRLWRRPGVHLYSHVTLRPGAEETADIRVLDEAGALVAELLGVHLYYFHEQALSPRQGAGGTSGYLSLDALRAAPKENWPRMMSEYLARVLAAALGKSAPVNAQQPVTMLGLDSLMAVDVKNQVEVDLELGVSVVRLLEGPTVEQLASEVIQQASEKLAAAVAASAEPTEIVVAPEAPRNYEELLARIDQLSAEEVDALLREMGSRPG
jgi:acyl transferase domain-containing protein